MKKSAVRHILNRILALMARFSPGATTLRPFLHRLRGVQIQGRVWIGDDVYLENECPECIELHDGCQICVRSILLAHVRGNGRIIIGKDAFLGANCVVVTSPGKTLTIGEGAVVAVSSTISSDVAPYTLVGNDRARPLAAVTVPLTMETKYQAFVAGLRPLRKL